MTYCPKCGTANRDGSRFCNQCGELLGAEKQVKCPQCGTLNPGQNRQCTECGAELEASSDVALSSTGLSPSTEAGTEPEYDEPLPTAAREEMPAWLRDMGATFSAQEQPVPDVPDEPAEIPAWLRDLRDSIPTESGAGGEQTGRREKDTEPSAEPSLAPEQQQVRPPSPDKGERKDWHAEPAEPEALPVEEEEEPDWLTDLRSAAREREFPAAEDLPEMEDEETPDWLARLQPREDDVPRASAKATPDAAGEAEPDWLDRGSFPEKDQDLEPELPAFDAEEEDSLDWLAELIPPAAETGAKATRFVPESGAEQAPDWLVESQAPAPETERELEAGQEFEEALAGWEPEEAGRPDPPDGWQIPAAAMLAGLSEPPTEEEPEERPAPDLPFPGSTIEGEEESEVQDKAGEEEELSEWLSELGSPIPELEPQPPAGFEDETGEREALPIELPEDLPPDRTPAAFAEELSDADVPAWLAELQTEGPEAAPSEPEEAAAETEAADWIMPSAPTPEEGQLERADIPAWLLALKPHELREKGEPAESLPSFEEIDRDTGLLAGIQGTLPVEMLIAQPRAATAARAAETSVTETENTRLFRDIVGRMPEAAPRQIAQAAGWRPRMLPRWLLYLTLIAVVTLPLLVPEPLFVRTIEPTQATTDLYAAIEALDSEATVLVAFDYDPTTSGEMEVISQALVGHLMDRRAKVVAISLLPAGPATAQPLLEGLAAEHPAYVDGYGTRYVNLGYLPGQATAVRLVALSPERALAVDFRGTPLADLPIMAGIASVEDFDLIVELAARHDSVRWWIEQASMPYGVRLGAGVSAPVTPLAQPYYETDPRQLVGLIGGVPGAVTYEALQREQGNLTPSIVSRLDSQMAGQLLLVLVLLVGNGIFLVQRGARR